MPVVNFLTPQKPQLQDNPSPIEKKIFDIHPATSKNVIRPKINKYIEIVTIHDHSAVGARKVNLGIKLDDVAISEILSQRYKTVRMTIIKTEADLKNLVAKKPDLVFSGTEYFDFYDEEKKQHKDIWFSDYLAEHHIAYIGSPSEIYKKAYDKVQAKEIIMDAGINTACFFTTEPDELTLDQSLQIDFPVFVKPDKGADSEGVDANSVVTDFEGLKAKVLDIYKNEQSRSLVEKYLPGKEYTVGVFEDSADGKLTAMPVEIIPAKNENGDRILDFDIKKEDEEQVIEVTNPKIHKLTSDLAVKAFKAMKARSHARIDIKMDEQGVPYFLEANLVPTLGQSYLYSAYEFNQKMSYEHMIYKITDNALTHHQNGR